MSAQPTASTLSLTCTRCEGAGVIKRWAHVDGGRCRACEGTGLAVKVARSAPVRSKVVELPGIGGVTVQRASGVGYGWQAALEGFLVGNADGIVYFDIDGDVIGAVLVPVGSPVGFEDTMRAALQGALKVKRAA